MRRLPFIITLSLLFFTGILFSQLTSGVITMSITDVHMPEMEGQEQMDGVSSMLKDMSMIIYFKPGEQVTKMNMMGMMDMSMYFKDGQMTQYMDMMGQKIKVITPVEEDMMIKLGVDKAQIEDMYDITYDKSSTVDILGYKCYKAIVKMDMDAMAQGEELPEQIKKLDMEWYITEDIKMENFNMQQMPGLKLAGTPLRMSLDMGMMTMTYEATNIEKTVDDSAFEEPTGDYKEMTNEELKQMGVNFGSNN